MRLALYQPDIHQNVGSFIRLAACLNVPLDIIEPCGFPFDLKRIRQSALDYIDKVELTRHISWEAFVQYQSEHWPDARLVLLTTKASSRHDETLFQPNDILIAGRESAGVPEEVHARADLRVRVPLNPVARSLNVVQAATIVLAEGLRQTEGFFPDPN